MSNATRTANHLTNETSLYLRQHVFNPVDWYPWGSEALERARTLDRPIFLSIGYSACHWCHVMEHESFENADIAAILNEQFVPIKVDREERPDLDQIYMTAVQILTGQGGWPMSVFLTPEQQPFYGGTYFPPVDQYGRPGFKRVLQAIAEAWRTRPAELSEQAQQIAGHIQEAGRVQREEGSLTPELIRNAVRVLASNFDRTYGGFGNAPKFPHAMDVRLLLRASERFKDDDALAMARLTLDRMAQGGIYDHLGGGFHRYSTDARWLVPHFEKMLYDNALLTVAYLDAYRLTQSPQYREVVDETLAYVLREMTSPEGGFYSTQDADTEGEEGKFFVWSEREIKDVLGAESADLFAEAYGISPEGNWEGHNILHRVRSDEQIARLRSMPEPEVKQQIAQGKHKLFDRRKQRIAPGRDEKVLTAWNGLMIDAFAQAATVLHNDEYKQAATRAADFIWYRMRRADGRLLRTYMANTEPKLNAYLEDYAFFLNSLVSLSEATGEAKWLESASALAELMLDQFWDSQDGGFSFTGRDHEALIARTKDPHDSSTPSGNSMAATALLRLATRSNRADFHERARETLKLFRGLMANSPTAAGQMLLALDLYLK
jgi:uncharacterized protein YyaL (SSP411 family)